MQTIPQSFGLYADDTPYFLSREAPCRQLTSDGGFSLVKPLWRDFTEYIADKNPSVVQPEGKRETGIPCKEVLIV